MIGIRQGWRPELKVTAHWGCIVLSLTSVALLSLSCSHANRRHFQRKEAVDRAVAFLSVEVPWWSCENSCFSCHNNGDGARALYLAAQQSAGVPVDSLVETTAWLAQPESWHENKGDPGFSDQRLANIQFAASMLAAIGSGFMTNQEAVLTAARLLIEDQDANGSWSIEPGNPIGSPATYGTALATLMAINTLKVAGSENAVHSVRAAERWLSRIPVTSVPAAATTLLAFAGRHSATEGTRIELALSFLSEARTSEGAWGPYAGSPAEVFDTSLALLALDSVRASRGVSAMIQEGRRFLLAQQLSDGSWAATTCPSGGHSYAQRISTTAWATMALIQTAE